LIESHYGVTIRDLLRQASQEDVTLITLGKWHVLGHNSTTLISISAGKERRTRKRIVHVFHSTDVLLPGTSRIP